MRKGETGNDEKVVNDTVLRYRPEGNDGLAGGGAGGAGARVELGTPSLRCTKNPDD
jgi:hypothetical protein